MYANIIVDISHEKLDKTFQYLVPEQLEGELAEGMRVAVPFGSRRITGYVVALTDTPEYDVAKLKPILSIEKGAVAIESELIALAAWMHKNCGGTMNQALKTVLPVKRRERQKEKKQVVLRAAQNEAQSLYAECVRKHRSAQAKLLAQLLECSPQPFLHLTKDLGISSAVIRNLEEKGIVAIERELYYRNPVSRISEQGYEIQLNEIQKNVVREVTAEFDAGRQHTYLLHGVTGSGKTEVYMELIAHAAAKGMQCIMLIPEIALTFQTVRRFYERFGDRVSILHSRLSPGERSDQLERAKNGEIDIMIGPRSALFTPFSKLGFIMIDEEHESSYKSETVPKYHARDAAIARARLAGASVVLGSATPSVDSYYRAATGEYRLLSMQQRAQAAALADCEVVDLRAELRAGNRSILSLRLQELIEDRLAKKQQVMLFLNRRGMAGFVSCRACGSVLQCPHCDVSLSQHKNGRLVCHYCGYETQMVTQCPSCGSRFIGGFKAGTQKIQEVTAQRFPGARILRMDYDTTRSKDSYEKILSAFARHEADILVGTQMIVKGHDFPNVTLVGVLAADLSLNISDYRASERTFQLVTQAAGRAGRGQEPGRAVIQTYQPDHFSIRAAKEQDYLAFYEEEALYRRLMQYPPVWNMLHIAAASARQEDAASCMEQVAAWIQGELQKPGADGVWKQLKVIGPADPPVAKVNDIYRRVLYMKHPQMQILVKVKDFLEKRLRDLTESKKVSVQFDFNPMNG
ncbi:MAG: primosomal protein N' [Eubacterium sp.]|nr:primosomal protein N' [Eubacterium sp.]